MTDPFRIEGPAIVSFSGGRTSAYMLRRILDAHNGVLPDNVHAAFANTGREMPATLDFVQRCGAEWNVPVVWLEFTARRKDGFRIVSHNSASRDGEPFAALIAAQKMLPNPVARFCTQELKIRTITRWAIATLGWERWTSVIGIRADEAHRIKDKSKQRWTLAHPLAGAGITKSDVLAFWRQQPFDLELSGPWEGNCDGCFLKSRAAIIRMLGDHPERMRWWFDQEAIASQRGVARNPAVAMFRSDRDPYAVIARDVAREPRLFGPDGDRMLADTDGCGVMCGV